MLVLALTPLGLGTAASSRALLTRCISGKRRPYVTTAEERAELLVMVDDVEAQARAEGRCPQWPRDADALCQGSWRLVATTRTAGSELLQQMAEQPALGTFRIRQNWKQRDGELRCDNVITVGRPNNGLLSAWTLLPAGGESSLTLQHTATVLDDGTAADFSADEPLRISIALDAVVLDGNRRAGDAVKTIVALPVPPRFPGVPPPPALPEGLAQAVADAGTFTVTYLDDGLRIARGATDRDGQRPLRIFARDDGRGLPTW